MCATLTASVFEVTCPTYSSMIFGRSPEAVKLVGFSMSVGIMAILSGRIRRKQDRSPPMGEAWRIHPGDTRRSAFALGFLQSPDNLPHPEKVHDRHDHQTKEYDHSLI